MSERNSGNEELENNKKFFENIKQNKNSLKLLKVEDQKLIFQNLCLSSNSIKFLECISCTTSELLEFEEITNLDEKCVKLFSIFQNKKLTLESLMGLSFIVENYFIFNHLCKIYKDIMHKITKPIIHRNLWKNVIIFYSKTDCQDKTDLEEKLSQFRIIKNPENISEAHFIILVITPNYFQSKYPEIKKYFIGIEKKIREKKKFKRNIYLIFPKNLYIDTKKDQIHLIDDTIKYVGNLNISTKYSKFIKNKNKNESFFFSIQFIEIFEKIPSYLETDNIYFIPETLNNLISSIENNSKNLEPIISQNFNNQNSLCCKKQNSYNSSDQIGRSKPFSFFSLPIRKNIKDNKKYKSYDNIIKSNNQVQTDENIGQSLQSQLSEKMENKISTEKKFKNIFNNSVNLKNSSLTSEKLQNQISTSSEPEGIGRESREEEKDLFNFFISDEINDKKKNNNNNFQIKNNQKIKDEEINEEEDEEENENENENEIEKNEINKSEISQSRLSVYPPKLAKNFKNNFY